jgi:hypothetical protein
MKEDKGDIDANNQTNENDQATLGETNEAVADVVNAPVTITSTSEHMSSIESENNSGSNLLSKVKEILNPLATQFLRVGQYFQGLISKLSEKVTVQQSYKYFLIFLSLGLLLLFFALFCIPFVIFNPGKLLRLLTFGNILIMLGFLFYYGSKDFFAFLVDQKRTGVMFSHILGLICSLFVSLFFGGYFLKLLLDFILCITTVMFILTLIPGGQGGIAGIKRMLISPLLLLFNSFKGKIFGESNGSVLPK